MLETESRAGHATASAAPSATTARSVDQRKAVSSNLECCFKDAEKRHKLRPFSCKGIAARSMTEVRRHLQNAHKEVPFLKQCGTCKEDILVESVFMTQHGEKGKLCEKEFKKVPKGTKAQRVQWDALYVKIEPLVKAKRGYKATVDRPSIPCM